MTPPPAHGAAAIAEIAKGLTKAQAKSCPTCKGKGYWQSRRGGERWPCHSCPIDAHAVSMILARMDEKQRSFLLFGKDTLADQPATPEDWDGPLYTRFFVEDDDQISDEHGVIMPATQYWFGSSQASYLGDGGDWKLSFRYNGNGLAVRASLAQSKGEE